MLLIIMLSPFRALLNNVYVEIIYNSITRIGKKQISESDAVDQKLD